MPANGRRDLIRCLKVKILGLQACYSVSIKFVNTNEGDEWPELFYRAPSCKIKLYSAEVMSVLVSTCTDFDFNTVALVRLQE